MADIVGDLSPYMSGMYGYISRFAQQNVIISITSRAIVYRACRVCCMHSAHLLWHNKLFEVDFFGMKNGIWTGDEDDNKTTTKSAILQNFVS